MAIRTIGLKRDREELVAYIHGVDPEYNMVHVLVHKKGKDVRFSGEMGSHKVSPSNARDLPRWMQEAQMVWKLYEVMGVPRDQMLEAGTLRKLEVMEFKAAKKKEEASAVPGL